MRADLGPRSGASWQPSWPTAAAKLLWPREARVHPGLDDKVLVSWNGLMIDALAQAAGVLDEPRYLAAAQRAADFILRDDAPARRPAAALAGGTARPGSTPISTTTPAWPTRW